MANSRSFETSTMFTVLDIITPLILWILFLNLAACAPLELFIGNGNDVDEPVPYQVSIQYNIRRPQHVCGGTIISSQHILTAAHCLDNLTNHTLKHLRILAGTSNLKNGGSLHKIKSFKIHPSYDTVPYTTSDIAIVKVTPRFKLNRRTIAKIHFENTELIPGETPVILTGWGLMENDLKPNILQIADFITVANEKCKQFYPDLTSSEICAHGQEDSFASYGDSGSPLVNENKTLLIGITSYGSPGEFNPDVFTRVSRFVEWIQEQMSII